MAKEERNFPEQQRLFRAILSLRSEDECRRFFDDICTISELCELAKRLKVARMLKDKKSYVQISKETGVSTATISRVNRALSWGEGGYEIALSRMSDEESETSEEEKERA